jgi:hypothetical protein
LGHERLTAVWPGTGLAVRVKTVVVIAGEVVVAETATPSKAEILKLYVVFEVPLPQVTLVGPVVPLVLDATVPSSPNAPPLMLYSITQRVSVAELSFQPI